MQEQLGSSLGCKSGNLQVGARKHYSKVTARKQLGGEAARLQKRQQLQEAAYGKAGFSSLQRSFGNSRRSSLEATVCVVAVQQQGTRQAAAGDQQGSSYRPARQLLGTTKAAAEDQNGKNWQGAARQSTACEKLGSSWTGIGQVSCQAAAGAQLISG